MSKGMVLLLAFLIALLGFVWDALAEQTVRWTTITSITEYETLAPEFTAIRTVWIPAGATWTLNAGTLIYWPEVVCHLWLNDVAGRPQHVPWVSWGTSNYLNIPAGLTISGPGQFYLWCWNSGPVGQIFYSLEWTVRP